MEKTFWVGVFKTFLLCSWFQDVAWNVLRFKLRYFLLTTFLEKWHSSERRRQKWSLHDLKNALQGHFLLTTFLEKWHSSERQRQKWSWHAYNDLRCVDLYLASFADTQVVTLVWSRLTWWRGSRLEMPWWMTQKQPSTMARFRKQRFFCVRRKRFITRHRWGGATGANRTDGKPTCTDFHTENVRFKPAKRKKKHGTRCPVSGLRGA